VLSLPQNPEDITGDWLAMVLDRPVTGCRLVDRHEGTTGRAELALEYAQRDGAPQRVFVKLPPGDERQRAFVVANGMGRREAMFYRMLSQEVPVRVPRCYFADWDDSGENYIMLLEHLEDSGCTFRNASSRYSIDYLRSVLDAFAALHARYWESSRFRTDLDWVAPPPQHPIARALVQRALERHAADMPAVFTAVGKLYQDHTEAIHRLWQEGPQTLVHGDVHDGNLFYERDHPGFLDWAIVARCNPVRDVGYFLAGTLTPQDQRDHGLELLRHYREALLRQGVDAPPLEELYRYYQWHAAYVWLGAAVTLAMGDAWQPVNYVLQSLERLHAALEQLGTPGALASALEERH
jgi:aminoglycoside/choline kinase family phosphotransferase